MTPVELMQAIAVAGCLGIIAGGIAGTTWTRVTSRLRARRWGRP